MNSIGIIGSGRWGRNIARSFSKKRNVKRVVSSGNADNLKKMKEIIPEIQSSSFTDVLLDNDIDAVVVAVPIENLSEIAEVCLAHNKHVFLEKPAAISTLDIERIEKARNNKVCLVNYLYLSDPSYESFKHAIKKTKIKSASFVWKKWGSFNNDILLNLASHDLSMLFDSLGSSLVTQNKIKISDDECLLDFNVGDVKVVIDIDRRSKNRHKTVMYETSDGLFMWTPGFFAHDEVEVSTNSPDNLLDIQRDTFLSHVRDDSGYANLDLSKQILNFIDRIRQ